MAKKVYAKLIRGNVHYHGAARFDRDQEVEVTPELAKTLTGVVDTITAGGESLDAKRFEIIEKSEAQVKKDAAANAEDGGEGSESGAAKSSGRRSGSK